MLYNNLQLFCCPICQSDVKIEQKTWQCTATNSKNGKAHCFDVAKQGYINLLPVQNKKSKSPGDSEESIQARKEFLDEGFYKPLKDCLKDVISNYTKDNNVWLDVGCGEGYYTKICTEMSQKVTTITVDISKPAVISLAKDYKSNNLLWNQQQYADTETKNRCLPLVASASDVPLHNNSIDIITTIFAPILVDEICRVLKETGYLVIAKPKQEHLQSIREALFDEVKEHDSDKFLVELEEKGFKLVEERSITTELSLNNTQLSNLLTMTPYSYRAKKERRESLINSAKSGNIKTQAEFVVYLLKRES